MGSKYDGKKQNDTREKIDQLSFQIDDYIKKNIQENTTVEVGNAFCIWCLYYLFDLNEDERQDAIKFSGANDNSIDAMFEINDQLYIIQTKYNKAHRWEAITKFTEDINRLSTGIVVGDRQEMREASATIRNYVQDKKEIKLFYITTDYINETFDRPKIKYLKEELEKTYYNFSINVFGIDEIKDYLEDKLNDIPKKYDKQKLSLGICSNAIEADDVLIAQVSLRDFYEFVSNGDEFLYYSNIRNYLKKTDVNRGIEKTLKEEPQNFWYYNNGVTIVCDEWELINRLVIITTPQIVNGCQTANSIKLFFKGLDKTEINKITGKLLIKIIRDKQRKKRNLITKYTNSQNAVKSKDFYSLDSFQKDQKQKLAYVGYFYEIQAGSSLVAKGKYRGEEKYKYLLPEKFDNVIPAKDLIQAYVSGIKQHPGIAYGKSGELTPVGDKWDLVIDDSPFCIEYYLFPYLVMKYAKVRLEYNSKSKDFRRSASLFFVSTYFKLLLRILVKSKQLDPYNTTPLNISLAQLNRVFEDEEFNIVLLNTVNRILRDYFKKDSTIKNKLVGDNLLKFLKIDVESNEAKDILLQYIDIEIEDNNELEKFFT